MFKKTVLFAAILALFVTLAGCACSGTVGAAPTPTIVPAATPSAEIIKTSPDVILTPETQSGSDAMASPDGGGMTAGGNAEGAGGGTGGGTGAGASTIENFKEGTEVKEADVPQVAAAIKAKYENATVKSIKHAMQGNAQVYEVEVTSGSTTQTVYVTPDGTVTPK